MGLYSGLANMVQNLLAPEAEGGLGQGVVELIRTIPGTQNASDPWIADRPDVILETLRAAVTGAEKYADGQMILQSDLRITAAVPAMEWRMGEDMAPDLMHPGAVLAVRIDGRPLQVIRTRGIPAAGTPAAIEIIARG
ncbi:hypothetical protein [Neotabrizicola sp. VNH66]|uniref:hypothetical protein n=1 Tax=Neotabrizicola sp. VNH66 TaxID=3400918 RepID=UPI003BFD6AAF